MASNPTCKTSDQRLVSSYKPSSPCLCLHILSQKHTTTQRPWPTAAAVAPHPITSHHPQPQPPGRSLLPLQVSPSSSASMAAPAANLANFANLQPADSSEYKAENTFFGNVIDRPAPQPVTSSSAGGSGECFSCCACLNNRMVNGCDSSRLLPAGNN